MALPTPANVELRSPQHWIAPPARKPSLIAPARFLLLNCLHDLDSPRSWNSPTASPLLLYNLHYFEDLGAEDSRSREGWHRRLVHRWIEENPPFSGVGWNAYPTSLRIVNWLKWMIAGAEPEKKWLCSLAIQAEAIRRRPEYDLRANHLVANAKALIFAGAVLDAPQSGSWLSAGLDILKKELSEQVLADGGHIEGSPMYHALILEDLLDLTNLSRAYPNAFSSDDFEPTLGQVIESMLRWLDTMTPPGGDVSRFNDASPGVALGLAQLRCYAKELGIVVPPSCPPGTTVLAASGYVRLQQGPVCLIFDVAPIEPAYNPGHAHADTLAFELTWNAQRLIVNSGTSQYGSGPERLWERSTFAHNSVEIDGQNSSEVWSGFRVARRAKPIDLRVGSEGACLFARCAHDGYRRLPGKPVHRREIRLDAGGIAWTDHIEGRGVHVAKGCISFHPDVRVVEQSPSRWGIVLASGEELVLESRGVELTREYGRFAPEFGRTLERPVLVWTLSGELPGMAGFSIRAE